MSARNDRGLKIATGVAIIVVIVGGSLYVGGLMTPGQRVEVTPLRADKQNPTVIGSETLGDAPTSAGGALDLGVSRPMMPELLSLARRPRVLPEDEFDGVRLEMERALVPWTACYEEAAGSPPEVHGKAFVHFLVDEDGEPEELKIRVKGIGEPSLVPCMAQATERLVFGETAAGTSVYWPVVLHRKRGAVLSEQGD